MTLSPPIRSLLSILVFCSLVVVSPAQLKVDRKASAPFKVLSWNIYMLPAFAKITGKRRRAHAIAQQLRNSDYDMLVLQEAFLGDARRIIGSALEEPFPHRLGPANKKFSIKTNSGIWILSRIPMRYLDEIDFSECAGFDDCMARKGALLVEVDWKGTTVQVLGTHLQAGGPFEIKHSQYDELRALLDRHRRPGVPQLICGDMNTSHLDSANYHRMIETMEAEDGPLLTQAHEKQPQGYPNDIHRGGFRSNRIIDYIFYRANGLPAQTIRRSMPRIQKRWSRRHQDLSDHFPIAVEVSW